jgi:hypothetical protein
MPPRINKGERKSNELINKGQAQLYNECVRFSFKYLELNDARFCTPDPAVKTGYFSEFLYKLKSISTMKPQEFRQAGKALRSHSIRWGDTSVPDGYAHLPAHLQECEPWQFSLSRSELGRVHGFWIDDVFYPVWLDHQHLLYPSK